MKICITSEGNTLKSRLDSRFGRCKYFIVYDIDSGAFEAFENLNAELNGGAGIQSAQFIASKRVKTLLSGYVGPNAHQTLTAAGIDVYSGAAGIINEVIEMYRTLKLKKLESPNSIKNRV